MKRGDLYRVYKPGGSDPKAFRIFVVVSRQVLIDSRFSTVICAPVFSRHDGLSSQVPVGIAEGLKHESAVHCDQLLSLPKSSLTHFVGSLTAEKTGELNEALKTALSLEDEEENWRRRT